GPLPSQIELETWLSSRPARHEASGSHWLDLTGERFEEARTKRPGLIEFCARFEAVELWIDPDPNAQLTLIWLLDFLRHHAETVSRLTLVQADVQIGNCTPEELASWRLPVVRVLNDHLETASLAWRAYRQPTPQDWFNLLGGDLRVLPQLGQSVLELLEELPSGMTGLGATETRMLELLPAGGAFPFDVFPGDNKPNKRRVFGYWEIGALLDGLAHCPAPAISGLEEGPFTLAMHDDRHRLERYRRSQLKLTALGQAILAGTEDFSRHNPIRRWWGGTELIGDQLWRWDPADRALIEPSSSIES
ncbi:hypothetical protein, partial [Bradyrhizobium sp.]|uniref:hypothetical protein n=1 Tax=Bradyrhizobium sp. TaxID=376 RepID=UPI0027277D74